MALNLYAADIPELVISTDYPKDSFVKEKEYGEHCLHINHPLAKGFYKEIFFDDIRIGYGDIALYQKTSVFFDTDFETVEMHFALSGETNTVSKNFQKDILFQAHHHNIIYSDSLKGKMEWNGMVNTFEINLSPAFFQRYLPENKLSFEIFKHKINTNSSSLICKQNNLITLQMYQVIQDIIHCKRKGLFKKIFLEAKVLELLLLQLEQLCDETSAHTLLKKPDIEKMYAVRDYILDNLTNSCSLIDLVHKVGTNEFTLKKGFKELFGTTVFGFWNDAKMEEARKMLQTKQMNINEVSDAIGYKNPQHFSTAFKRKFGVVPKSLKGK